MPDTHRQVLFIQGGGEDAHDWDAKLAQDLQQKLGRGYNVVFPKMPNEADPNYAAWSRAIRQELKTLGGGVVLVGHSIGASMLMKMLADGEAGPALEGVFILSAPYLHERDGWQWKEAELPASAAKTLPKDLPVFLYHGTDDETVPFDHLALYARALPTLKPRALEGRNHQLNDDLTEVAADIQKLRR